MRGRSTRKHKETDNKTIRFPSDLIKEIKEKIEGKDISFSRFVIIACRYALSEMEPDETDEQE